jgi:hypothetical protein
MEEAERLIAAGERPKLKGSKYRATVKSKKAGAA